MEYHTLKYHALSTTVQNEKCSPLFFLLNFRMIILKRQRRMVRKLIGITWNELRMKGNVLGYSKGTLEPRMKEWKHDAEGGRVEREEELKGKKRRETEIQ